MFVLIKIMNHSLRVTLVELSEARTCGIAFRGLCLLPCRIVFVGSSQDLLFGDPIQTFLGAASQSVEVPPNQKKSRRR